MWESDSTLEDQILNESNEIVKEDKIVTNKYGTSNENKITNIEDNRWDIEDSKIILEENKPFYYNKYFIIAISIITFTSRTWK